MAINKNFVVKNGIEVNTNLIVADTDSNKVGIGTTVPEYTLHVFQGTGIGASTINVTGVGTFLEELNVGLAGTTLTAISNATLGIGGSVGVGTDDPGYLLEVHSPVTSGQTALYVRGDMVVTGDINIDDISIGDLNVSGISTFVGNVIIGTGATVGFGSTAFFKDYAKAIFGDGEDLKVYHDGTSSYVDNSTGDVYIRNFENDRDIFLQTDDGSGGIVNYVLCNGDNGKVELFHYGGARFNTNAIGVEATGTLQSTGITTLASSGGITTTGGDLYVGGDLYINEDIVLDTNLEILGIATIGSIHVTGISTFDGDLRGPNLTNSIVVGTGLSVRGSATGVAVTLAGAGGITTTGGDLYVGGDLYINEDIVLDTNLTILGIATIGSLNLSNTSGINTIDSTVQSTSKDTGSLVLQGGLGVEKQLYVGAGASVGAGLTVKGNLLPEADGTRDLGASGTEWKDLYIDGTANIDSLAADTAAIGDLTNNRVVIAGSSGELEDSADLTFDGDTLAVNAIFDSNDATQSSSSTTGSAQFAGGVGVAKNLYVGGGQVTVGIHTITDLRVGTQLAGQTLVGITTILDEDNMASNSAAALVTQQSIKAYVDAQVTASDLDFQGDSGGAQSVDLDSQTFTIAGTSNEIETSSSGQTLTVGLPNDVTIGNDLTVTNDVSIADKIIHTGDTNTSIRFPAADTFTVETAGSERTRVDSSGRLLINTTTSRIVEDHVGNGPQGLIQIEAEDSAAIMSIISAGDVDADRCGTISLGRHRNGTVGGTPTIVQDGDALGAVVFSAGDGTDMRTAGAKIFAEVDGTPGSNDMPGALILATTADGAANATERLRIDSGGRLLVGHTSNATPYVSGKVQVSATDSTAAVSIARYQNSASNPYFALVKSRGGLGAATIVQDNDGLGYIAFVGADGNDLTSEGAAITAEVDGTPGQDDMPGRLVFKTTADGASSSTERLRITSDGKVRVPDDGKFSCGAGDDLNIYHSSNTNIIDTPTSRSLQIKGSGITLRTQGNENFISCTENGSVELYHDNSTRFTTTADGVDFSGTGSIKVPVGTTGQRNASPTAGDFRYNSTTGDFEGYTDSWGAIAGGGGGSETDTSVSSTSATSIYTTAHATNRSVSAIIQITQGSSYQVGRYLVIHNGTTATIVEESAIATGDMLGSFTADINGSNLRILVNMGSASSATVTILPTVVTV